MHEWKDTQKGRRQNPIKSHLPEEKQPPEHLLERYPAKSHTPGRLYGCSFIVSATIKLLNSLICGKELQLDRRSVVTQIEPADHRSQSFCKV
jgi:hypothetical protein